MKVGLIACSSRKNDKAMAVEKLYSKSPLFRCALEYSKKHYNAVYCLSARHGLLPLTKVIKPYDESLSDKRKQEVEEWLEKTAEQIKQTIPKGSELYFHTGLKYRKLILLLEDYRCFEPTKGMGIGQQLKFYKEVLRK